MTLKLNALLLLAAAPFAFLQSAASTAPGIYVAEGSAGAGNGVDCADALPITFFNSAGNWASPKVAGKIGPGDTVFLCGTITSNLSFHGNGSSGSPVVLDGATLSAYIDVGTQYWTIQNVTYSRSYGTGSSTQAALQLTGGAAFGTIQNNTIDVINSAQVIFLAHVSHDITIQNNFLRVSAPSGDGFDTDVLDTEGSYNVMVQGNYMELAVTGDQSCGGCHDDVTQVWASGSSSANAPYNWTYRYNRMVANSPGHTNNLSLTMIEMVGNGYWNMYGNVFECIAGGSSGNGIVFDSNTGGMIANIFNNTVVEKSGACNNIFNLSGSGAYNLSNNIVYSASAGSALTGGAQFALRSHNLWYGSSIPSCSGFAGDVCGSDPLFVDYTNNNFYLQGGSPAKGTGVNVGALYALGLAGGATWPNPALSTRSTWDMGAYTVSAGGAIPPLAPTGIHIQ
jgi:hypothetical protein